MNSQPVWEQCTLHKSEWI